jgi:hypothetical protein
LELPTYVDSMSDYPTDFFVHIRLNNKFLQI